MSVEKFEALTPEEFDKRLETSNEQKRPEIIELEERTRKWEALIARKEAFLARLQQTLAEIEREDDEIAAMEKELPPLRRKGRRRQPVSPVLQ